MGWTPPRRPWCARVVVFVTTDQEASVSEVSAIGLGLAVLTAQAGHVAVVPVVVLIPHIQVPGRERLNGAEYAATIEAADGEDGSGAPHGCCERPARRGQPSYRGPGVRRGIVRFYRR